MASPVKLFQFFQKVNETMGIYESKSKSRKCLFNSRSIFYLFVAAQFWSFNTLFLVFEAESMVDYGFGFYTFISVICCLVPYLLFIWQFENMLKFVENSEKFLLKS